MITLNTERVSKQVMQPTGCNPGSKSSITKAKKHKYARYAVFK